MTTTETRDQLEHARNNAKGWYETIKEQVEALRIAAVKDHETGDCADRETAEQTIQEGPLSVMVRDGWHQPGHPSEDGPEEFEILLTTGGPALRIWGKLDKHGQPGDFPELQMQDWGTPWTTWYPDPWDENYREVLQAYASCFYFGE
jgi:hypothetical protein